MSYTELESGYQDLKQASRPEFFVGHGGNGDIDSYGESNDGMDSDCSASSSSGKQVNVGICAMAKKTQSKPMKEILTRLQEFEYIKIIVFPEDVIIKEPVENWPICDCLISFHSKGFPLDKAIQYAQLRKPYVINNLHMQYDIQDRRRVYAILESEGIEIPRYAVLDRDSPDPKKHELIESEDHVEVNGVIFNKPFVEKPVSAEDHNIYIYYPTSAGGGSQRLFRKIGSRSSVYSPESRVRKTGSFIYEDFMPTDGLDIKVYTVGPDYSHAEARKCPILAGCLKRSNCDGTDVKVYTVGPDYAHAEARKSPALDGKVERDSEGKEIRYPVILNNTEKLISRKVCLAFKQTVCGFDLLRANGKSYVCDVNGFSFVKNSNKYYDDCAKILGNMILRELTPTLHIPWSVPFQLDDPPIVPTTFGKMMELRCVVAVIRHGDRTPKQKMKVEVRHPKFFEIFEKYDGYKHGHVKLKRPKQLQEILDIARSLLAEIQTKAADSEIEVKQGKLEQLKSVLEMYGHFSGINRKVQMKYQPKGRPRGSSSDDGNSSSSNSPQEPSLVLILKWGGELTPAGRIQAEELGRIFRCMYPGGQGRHDYSGTQGLGLLRLHSTFRHDLKIYASDEGRVQMTAAAFAKGLLALEGELTPILVQMVKSANTNGLLDNDCDSSKYQNMAKNRLHELMQIDREFTKEDREAINPGNSISINQALDFVKNPVKCCAHVQSLIQSLLAVINVKKEDPKTKDAILYHGETWDLMARRWEKIEKDFSMKSKAFDISKIPDIYDCIKYDLQHNQHTLQYEQAEELYIYAKYLADIVIPQEYGLTMQEKLTIGQGICTPLLKKIKADLQRNIEEVGDESVNRLNPRYSHGVSSPGRHVRTRLYFTSESHVHSLLTVLRYGGLLDVGTDEQWRRAMEYISMVSELNYMSQIVIMLYEDPTKDPSSEERFHVELHFSPGVNCCVQKNLPPGPGFRPHSRNDSGQSKKITPEDQINPTRIDEEIDINLEDSPLQNSKNPSENVSSPEEVSEVASLPQHHYRPNRNKSSNPIPISHHYTVCGHEAMDLAKRLSEELAAQQQNKSGSLDENRTVSPDPPEPRSRSYEQQIQKDHKEDVIQVNNENENSNSENGSSLPPSLLSSSHSTRLFKIETSTNELPLSEIDFSINPSTPESITLSDSNPMEELPPIVITDERLHRNPSVACISPLATNERPLSCTCLTSLNSDENIRSKPDKNFHEDSHDNPHNITLTLSRPILMSRHKMVFNDDITATDAIHATFFSSVDHIDSNHEKHDTFIDLYHSSCSAPAILDLYSSQNSSPNIDATLHHSLQLPSKSKFTSNQEHEQLKCKLLPDSNYSDYYPNLNSPIISDNLNVPNCSATKTCLIPQVKSDNTLNLSYAATSISNNRNNDNFDNDNFNLKMNDYSINIPNTYSIITTTTNNDTKIKKIHTITTRNATTISNLNPPIIISSSSSSSILTQTPIPPLPPPHHQNTVIKIHNSDNTPPITIIPTTCGSASTGTTRRQRHSIAGQMNYFKMLGFGVGGFGKKITTSTNSLFSTAVISGSSSAPNLRDMIPSTATPSVLEGFGGVPPIRPLETLHNALSLKQLDGFLEKMTTAPLFKTPASSPPKNPSTPVPSSTQQLILINTGKQEQEQQQQQQQQIQSDPISWSAQSSMNSSSGETLSGTEPSSPNVSEDVSPSLASVDGSNILQKVEEISKFFPKLDDDLNSICAQLNVDAIQESDVFVSETENRSTNNNNGINRTMLISISSDNDSALATKGSTTVTETTNDEDDESTISVDTLSTTAGDVDDMKTSQNSLPPLLTVSEEKLFPCIQKQISLFEGALSSSSSKGKNNTIDRELIKFKTIGGCGSVSGGKKLLSERRGRFETIDSTIFLAQSTSNDNFMYKKESSIDSAAIQSPKTKSCMNLKSCNFHHPGAIVVKERFIEPPKRVTRSFHGKTEHARSTGSKSLDEDSSYGHIAGAIMSTQKSTSVQRLRFITTKVDENSDNNK